MEYGKITPFTVHCAAISDEDAPPKATEQLLIVCDGLGGTGQTKHKIGDQYYTSAYIGSRCVSDAIKKYCDEHALQFVARTGKLDKQKEIHH